MGNAPDLDWGKLFKAVWRYVLLLVGAWLALRYCSYHDSVMGMFFVACVVVIRLLLRAGTPWCYCEKSITMRP